jgi:hypothetical protein
MTQGEAADYYRAQARHYHDLAAQEKAAYLASLFRQLAAAFDAKADAAVHGNTGTGDEAGCPGE